MTGPPSLERSKTPWEGARRSRLRPTVCLKTEDRGSYVSDDVPFSGFTRRGGLLHLREVPGRYLRGDACPHMRIHPLGQDLNIGVHGFTFLVYLLFFKRLVIYSLRSMPKCGAPICGLTRWGRNYDEMMRGRPFGAITRWGTLWVPLPLVPPSSSGAVTCDGRACKVFSCNDLLGRPVTLSDQSPSAASSAGARS